MSLSEAMRLDDERHNNWKQGEGFVIHRGESRDAHPLDTGTGSTTGRHWTTNPIIARRFADNYPGTFHVMWHGVLDDRAEQEEPDPHRRDGGGIEREITMKQGAAVRVTGVSVYSRSDGETGYAPRDAEKWEHYDFSPHSYLAVDEKSREHLGDDPTFQQSMARVRRKNDLDVWEGLAGGDTDNGLRAAQRMSPSQFAGLRRLNPDYRVLEPGVESYRRSDRYKKAVFSARSINEAEEAGVDRVIHPNGAGYDLNTSKSIPSHLEQWMSARGQEGGGKRPTY